MTTTKTPTQHIFRTRKQGNFTAVANEPFNDESLTLEARGLLAYLLTKPNHWQISTKQLQSACNIGRDKLRRIMQELISTGYIYQERLRDNSTGQFFYRYDIFETKTSNPAYTAHAIARVNQQLDTSPSTPFQSPAGDVFTVDGKHVNIVNTEYSKKDHIYERAPEQPIQNAASAHVSVAPHPQDIPDHFAAWLIAELNRAGVPLPSNDDEWYLISCNTTQDWVNLQQQWPDTNLYATLTVLAQHLGPNGINKEVMQSIINQFKTNKYPTHKITNLIDAYNQAMEMTEPMQYLVSSRRAYAQKGTTNNGNSTRTRATRSNNAAAPAEWTPTTDADKEFAANFSRKI